MDIPAISYPCPCKSQDLPFKHVVHTADVDVVGNAGCGIGDVDEVANVRIGPSTLPPVSENNTNIRTSHP